MRAGDRTRLAQPYKLTDQRPRSERLGDALQIPLKNVRELGNEVTIDLDRAVHGVGWWNGYALLGDKRRIFISDYLSEVIRSVEVNLIEAKLHYFELLDYNDQLSSFLSNAVVQDPATGDLKIEHPEHKSPIEEIPGEMIGLHEAGVLRCLGSTLDCLGGAVVGIIGLPTPIIKADLSVARRTFSNLTKEQLAFQSLLENTITNSGPLGWLEWTNDYRNMVVHRARRLRISLMNPGLKQGRLITVPVALMARAPGRSDIEDFEDRSIEPVLTEDSITTIDGLFSSIRKVLEVVSRELISFWRMRKNNPQLIEQPKSQWPSLSSSGSGGQFRGFNPGTYKYNPSTITGNPWLLNRLVVASLDDKNRSKWKSFT